MFCVVKQVTPPSETPFKILETYRTSDGLRSRLCDGRWKTQEEAEAVMEGKIDHK